jgi:endonuclease/exonuclease/phosphatase family metal-dependent hydrolase
MNFAIATYNICLFVAPPLSFNGAYARSLRIADAFYSAVKDIDVIILQELVVHRDDVLKTFIHHKHHTRVVSSNILSDNMRFLSSGLAIVSRFPIVKERSYIFRGPAYHLEALCSKGVVYAKLDTPNGFVHVFNTHTNAWTTPQAFAARESQCQQIGIFIKSMEIPKNEYVFFGGDINMCIYEHGDAAEKLAEMLGGCNFHKPTEVSFSTDPLTNSLVGTDDASEYATRSRLNGCYEEFLEIGQCLCCPRQLLDLIGTMSFHSQPTEVSFQVVPVKARAPFLMHLNILNVKNISDVSDHYPTVLRCKILDRSSSSVEEDEEQFVAPNSANIGWLIAILVFSVAYFIILLTIGFCIYNIYSNFKK